MASVSETLQTALKHHQTGALQEAEALYRQIIRVDPSHADALHLLGVSFHQQNRNEAAVDYIRRAITADRSAANYHNSLGVVYRTLGDSDKAIKSFRGAIRNDPDFVDAHYNLGTLQKDQGQHAEAVSAFRRAVRIRPNHPEAHNNLGVALKEQGNPAEAVKSYRRALEFAPDFAEAHHNLGTALLELDQDDEALERYRKAIDLKPDYAEAHFNIGNVYRKRDQLDEAASGFRRALELDANFLDAHINLGIVLKDMGKLEEAIVSNDRALELDPQSVEAHINRSFVHRLKGDLALGWAEFDWRFKEENIPDRFDGPVWDGGSLEEKALLIYAEQGLGDEIMCASCITEVGEQAAHCVVECDARLMPLFARSFPGIELVERIDDLETNDRRLVPPFDVRVSIGGLVQHTRPDLKAFPKQEGYLIPDPRLKEEWHSRLSKLGEQPKIGISWRGGKRTDAKRRRSTRLDDWVPLLSIPGVHFVNLQYGDCTGELKTFREQSGVVIHDWSMIDPLSEMEQFAAAIASLDLVISVDNSTVHMAGALGTSVWTLLPFAPDWRWLTDCDDTHWYPTMRLFRQPATGDWVSLFRKVADELSTVIAQRERRQSDAFGRIDASQMTRRHETKKYERMWSFDTYREDSHGLRSAEAFALISKLKEYNVQTVLDAGCGSGKLMRKLMVEHGTEFDVHGFDISANCLDSFFDNIRDKILTVGCLWEREDFNSEYDAIICTDVMEHIPPEYVPAVLENFSRCTKKMCFVSIALFPDSFGPVLLGESLHLTVEEPQWWLSRITEAGFSVREFGVEKNAAGRDMWLHVILTASA